MSATMPANCAHATDLRADCDRQANLARSFERRAARLADALESLRLRGAQIRAARTAESALESAECGVLDIEMLQEDMELASLTLAITRFALRRPATK